LSLFEKTQRVSNDLKSVVIRKDHEKLPFDWSDEFLLALVDDLLIDALTDDFVPEEDLLIEDPTFL
jgi:hypothetical protein